MSRLDIKSPSRAETVVENLYRDMERRIAASPPGLCPVDMALSFLRLCHAQSCGKCVPCRIGLGQLSLLLEQVLAGTATMSTLVTIEKTARTIVNTADCAIGRDAARLVVDGLGGLPGRLRGAHPAPAVPGGAEIPGALRGPVPGRGGYSRLHGPGGRGPLRRRGAADPQGQPLPHRLRLHLRASLRGSVPPEHD